MLKVLISHLFFYLNNSCHLGTVKLASSKTDKPDLTSTTYTQEKIINLNVNVSSGSTDNNVSKKSPKPFLRKGR